MSQNDIKSLQNQILSQVVFYQDLNSNDFFAKYFFRGHYEVHPVGSAMFLAFLDSSLRTLSNNKYQTADWSEAIKIKKQDCLLNDSPVEIYKRLAGAQNEIWYFLADKDWSCIYLNKAGWSRVTNYDPLFIKKKNTKEQILPISDGHSDRLRPYVNLSQNDYLLFKINLAHCFFYKSSHHIGVLSSEFGSGKSTLTRVCRRIVDPAHAEFTSLSTNIDDFKIQLANNDFVMLDNTSKLKNDFSNIICGATTGSSFSVRQLYTDYTELILKVKNIFFINGIDIVPRRQDLLSRCLLFELLPISNTNRKTEAEFWASFEKDLPYILGDIFDTICDALKILESLEDVPSGRMADATKEMLAIALAMGVSQAEFYGLLEDNAEKLKSACAKEQELIVALLEYMESNSKDYIVGTVANIYNEIKNFKKGNLKNLPKSPSLFSRKINELKPLLLSSGISVTSVTQKDGTHMTITRTPQP